MRGQHWRLCDPAEWSDYKSEQAKYAIGGSSIEMLMKSL